MYVPQANEDVSTVVKHLHRAGIVVLLLLDENQKNNIKTTDVNYITDWDKEGTEVEQVAGFIHKQSNMEMDTYIWHQDKVWKSHL